MACHLECYESCVDLGRRSKFISDYRGYCSKHTLSYIVDENRSGNNHFIQCSDDINRSKATLVQSSHTDNSSFNNDSSEQSQRVSKISSAQKSQQSEDPNPPLITLFHKITCWAFGWHCKDETLSVVQEVKREVVKEKSGVTREEFVPVEKAPVKAVDPAAEHYVDPCESAKTQTSQSSKVSTKKKTECEKINYSQYRSFPLPTNKEHQPHLVAKAKEANRRIRSRSFSPSVSKKKICKTCGVNRKNNPEALKKQFSRNLKKEKKKPASSPGSKIGSKQGSRPRLSSTSPQQSKSPSQTVILKKQKSKSPVHEDHISYPSSPTKETVRPDSDEVNEDVLPYLNDDIQSQYLEGDTFTINEIPSIGQATKTKTNEHTPKEQVTNTTTTNVCEINKTVPAEPNIITKSICSSKHYKGENTKNGSSDCKDETSSIDNRSVLSSLCEHAEKLCKGQQHKEEEERPYVPGSFFPNKSILDNIKFLPRLKKRKRSKTTQKSSSKRHKTRCSRSTPGIQIVFYPDDQAPAMCSSFPNIVPKDRFRSQSLSNAPPNCAPPNCFQCSVCMNNCGPECACVICKILNADKKGAGNNGNRKVTRKSKSVERNNKKCNNTKTNKRGDKCRQVKGGGELSMPLCAKLCPGIAGQKQCNPFCRPSSSICTPTCGLNGMGSDCVYSGLGMAYERSMKEDSYCKSLLAKYTLKSPYYECMKPSPATMGYNSYGSCPQMSFGTSCEQKDKKETKTKPKPKPKPTHVSETHIAHYDPDLHVNNSRTKSATPDKVQVQHSKLKASISYSEKPKEIDAYKEVQLNNCLKCFDPPPIVKHKGIASPVHLFTSLKKVEDPPKRKKNEKIERKDSTQRTRSKSPSKNRTAKNKNNGALEYEDDEEYMHFRGRLANNFCRKSCQKSKISTFRRFDRNLTRLTSIDNLSSPDEFEIRFSPPSTQSCQNNNFGEENFRFFRKYLRITPSTSTAHTAMEQSSVEESLRQDMLEDARHIETDNQFSENNVVSETVDEDKVEEKIARLDDWILGNYPEGFSMTTGKKTLQKKKSTQGISASSKKKGSTRVTQRKKTVPVQNRIGRSADVEVAKRVLTINPSDLIKNRSPQRSNPVLNDMDLDNALSFESPRKGDIMYTDSPVLPPPEHYTPQYSMEENFTERSDYIEDDYMNEQLQMLPQRGGEWRSDSGVKDEVWRSGAPNDMKLGFRKPSEHLSSPVTRKESGALPEHGSMPNNGYRRDMQKSPQKDNQSLKNNSPRRQRDLSVTKREDLPLEEDKDVQVEGDTSAECKESCVDGMEFAHTKKESGDESIQESASLTQSLFSKFTSMWGGKSRKTVSEFALKAVPSEHILQGQESSVDIDQKPKETPLPTNRSRSMRLIRDGSSNNDYVDKSPECIVEEIGEDIDADSDLALRFSSMSPSGSRVFQFHESAARNVSLNRGGCGSEEDVRGVPSCESQVTRDSVCSPAVSGPMTASSVTTACSTTTCSGVSCSSSCVTSTASSATTLCGGMSPRWQPVGANGPNSLTAKVASMNLQQLLGPSPGIKWSKVEDDCDVTAIKEAKERFMQMHRRKKAGATAKAAEEASQKESSTVVSKTLESIVKVTDEVAPQAKVDTDSVENKAITQDTHGANVVSVVKAGAESGDAPSDKLNEINATEDADKDEAETVVDTDEAVEEKVTPVDKATEELVLGTVNKESPFMEDVSGVGAGVGVICTQP